MDEAAKGILKPGCSQVGQYIAPRCRKRGVSESALRLAGVQAPQAAIQRQRPALSRNGAPCCSWGSTAAPRPWRGINHVQQVTSWSSFRPPWVPSTANSWSSQPNCRALAKPMPWPPPEVNLSHIQATAERPMLAIPVHASVLSSSMADGRLRLYCPLLLISFNSDALNSLLQHVTKCGAGRRFQVITPVSSLCTLPFVLVRLLPVTTLQDCASESHGYLLRHRLHSQVQLACENLENHL